VPKAFPVNNKVNNTAKLAVGFPALISFGLQRVTLEIIIEAHIRYEGIPKKVRASRTHRAESYLTRSAI